MEKLFTLADTNGILFMNFSSVTSIGDIKKDLTDVIAVRSWDQIDIKSNTASLNDHECLSKDCMMKLSIKKTKPYKNMFLMHISEKNNLEHKFVIKPMKNPWMKTVKDLCDQCEYALLSISTVAANSERIWCPYCGELKKKC